MITRIDLSKPRWCHCGSEIPTSGALKALEVCGVYFALHQRLLWSNGYCSAACEARDTGRRPPLRVVPASEET